MLRVSFIPRRRLRRRANRLHELLVQVADRLQILAVHVDELKEHAFDGGEEGIIAKQVTIMARSFDIIFRK